MVIKCCNQRLWRSCSHFQNTHNLARFSPLVSLSSNLKSSSWCCFTTRLYFKETHIRHANICQQRSQLTITKSQPDDLNVISTSEDVHEDDISKATLIWRAIKLPIYSVALVPLTVGTAAAYLQTGLWSAKQYALLLASSILVITWLNLSNDVYDFDTGADINKKESVVNMIGSRSGTLTAALLLLGLGSMGLVWAALKAGNVRSMLLLASAIICGYIYQCPPFRLSYRGLGEPLCFAAFGPFATTAFYLLQGSSTMVERLPITGTILSASVLVGITTSLILFCSHFHQITGDKAVGKYSPLVRIGTEAGSNVVKIAVTSLYSILLLLGIFKTLPITSIFLCALTVPVGKLVVSFVADNHQDKTKIFMAKYFCVRLHALFGATLAVGMVAARIITKNNALQTVIT
ncbi:ubiA prenyltransferase family [Artemisia annua]|uniref:UbiA prenyltransferase family n=1 Tax=Artemisia annua TaxID=35608 RepID=A0A2U1PWH9_ARTAN|nr:ubiA prenyltransferase family [Artemisia annua]